MIKYGHKKLLKDSLNISWMKSLILIINKGIVLNSTYTS